MPKGVPQYRTTFQTVYWLTSRQREVLALIASGCTNEEIAVHLFISLETAKAHVRSILERLEAKNRAHAVAVGLARKIIEPCPLDEWGRQSFQAVHRLERAGRRRA